MRHIFERTRLHLYIALFRWYSFQWSFETSVKQTFNRKCHPFIIFDVILLAFRIIRSTIFTVFIIICSIVYAVIVDLIWITVVPSVFYLFSAADGYPSNGMLRAHLRWKDKTSINTIPLDLFRLRGEPLLTTNRCCIFLAKTDHHYYELLRLFRVLSDIDSSVHIIGIDTVVMVYNRSPHAKAVRTSDGCTTLYLPIPNRCDIRVRSRLTYSLTITICKESNAHNGLVNADTFREMTAAIHDCCNT